MDGASPSQQHDESVIHSEAFDGPQISLWLRVKCELSDEDDTVRVMLIQNTLENCSTAFIKSLQRKLERFG